MAYESKPFLKIRNGIKAPNGFHYMPNGKLMSDADHVAMFGYIDQKINSININLKDIHTDGETRRFSIFGDEYAIFSLKIFDSNATPKYYNFYTETWSTEVTGLDKISLNKNYTGSIAFPALTEVPGGVMKYTINLIAETCHNVRTIHANLVEVRNADNSININESKGSSSNVLTKILNQDTVKTLKLSAIAPSLYEASSSTVDGATSSSNRIVIDGDATDKNIVQVGDKVTSTGVAASVHALVGIINPDGDNTNEIQISISDSCSDGALIASTPPFNGMTPHDDDSDAGSDSFSVPSGNSFKSTFSVSLTPQSGRIFRVLRNPTVEDLCAYKTVTFGSAALALEGEDVSASTYFRWPVDNIASLKAGMLLDPARTGTGANTTTPAFISDYRTTKTEQQIIENAYGNYINSETVDDVVVDAVDTYNNIVTTVDRNGRTTAQAGNIIFDTKQADALKSDSGVRIFAHGPKNIETLTGVKVNISNIDVAFAGDGTNEAVSTTTSGAVSSSTTIGLTSVTNVSKGMQVRGVGISASTANPTVVSKSASTGGANITVSAAQTLESGQTLFFDNGSGNVTIRGTIEVSNMDIANVDLFFDVERFLESI